MTYVVNEKCIKCKYTDCVVVCPVDCFYEGNNMLVINPDECIDCGICVAECPINAIEEEKPELHKWIELARKYSKVWPVITKQKAALPNAEQYKDEEDKFIKYFEENIDV